MNYILTNYQPRVYALDICKHDFRNKLVRFISNLGLGSLLKSTSFYEKNVYNMYKNVYNHKCTMKIILLYFNLVLYLKIKMNEAILIPKLHFSSKYLPTPKLQLNYKKVTRKMKISFA